MKKVFLLILTVTGLFGHSITGGMVSSTANGEVEGLKTESINGKMFGLERTLGNGLIAGIRYTQRGWANTTSYQGYDYDDDYDYDDYGSFEPVNITHTFEFKINYLSTYILKPFPLNKKFSVLAGGEIGYFWSGEMQEKRCGNSCNSDRETVDRDDWDEVGNNFDYGLLFGARYYLNSTISLTGSYYMGLSKVFHESPWGGSFDPANRGIQIGVSYALGGGGGNKSKTSKSSKRSSSSSSGKSSDSEPEGCTPPSKSYGNGDVDGFLNNSYKVCEILSETTEKLNEVNDFVENPRMFIIKKANEATGPYRETLSSIREFYSDPEAVMQDAFAEMSAEATMAFKEAQDKLAEEFKRKIEEFLIQQLIEALGLATDGVTGSGDALGGVKSLGFADKMKAVKDVKGALKNLKSAVDTIPKLQEELNRASENLGKLLN